jgi:DNA-binding response OmpR family regulator
MKAARVLVVDDEPHIVRLVAFKLSLAGYQTVGAPSAEAALEEIDRTLPDLIVLDVYLSDGMSGLDLVARLKRDSRTAGIPILLLTAHSLEADKNLARRLGADGYITKPFSARYLAESVARFLERNPGA